MLQSARCDMGEAENSNSINPRVRPHGIEFGTEGWATMRADFESRPLSVHGRLRRPRLALFPEGSSMIWMATQSRRASPLPREAAERRWLSATSALSRNTPALPSSF